MNTNSALVPEPRDAAWLKRHEEFVARAREGSIDLLFLGDSITDWWREPDRGAGVWEAWLAGKRAANFGINADRTQHLLWRLRNGELEGYVPKVVVLLIGTNNTGMEKDRPVPRNTAEETVEGIRLVLDEIRHRFPTAQVILLGLFPRAEPGSLQRLQVEEINRSLSTWGDGRAVFYLDFGNQFLDAEGRTIEEIMPDGLHLSAKGYSIWAEAMDDLLQSLWKD